jgi:hypothetical protein
MAMTGTIGSATQHYHGSKTAMVSEKFIFSIAVKENEKEYTETNAVSEV